MKLPIGDEAAARRRRTVAGYADEVERELPADTPDEIRTLLAQVREEPLDFRRWTYLSSALYVRFHREIDAGTYERWERPRNWAKQGAYMACKMQEISSADAPICDEHGPMQDSPDPSIVPQSHDGRRWCCAGVADCRSGYWWIDGTHLRRMPRSAS